MPRIVSFETAISASGKAGQGAAAGEIDAEAVQQRHGAEGDQDRMHAEDRDQQAGDEADERRIAPGRQRGRRRARGRAPPRRVRRHQRGQDPGHQQSGLVRGGDDREIDAAGDRAGSPSPATAGRAPAAGTSSPAASSRAGRSSAQRARRSRPAPTAGQAGRRDRRRRGRISRSSRSVAGRRRPVRLCHARSRPSPRSDALAPRRLSA